MNQAEVRFNEEKFEINQPEKYIFPDRKMTNNKSTKRGNQSANRKMSKRKTRFRKPILMRDKIKIPFRTLERIERFSRESRQHQLAEYHEFKQNPRKIILVNLVIGLSRGVGFVLGVSVFGTMILGLLTWILSNFLDIPVIGKFVADIIESAESYLKNNQP